MTAMQRRELHRWAELQSLGIEVCPGVRVVWCQWYGRRIGYRWDHGTVIGLTKKKRVRIQLDPRPGFHGDGFHYNVPIHSLSIVVKRGEA